MRPGALFAALPMYDFPDVAWANDALWRAIAGRLRAVGIDAPEKLTRSGDFAAQWRDRGLLFGQTCGYPYMEDLRESANLIATPDYALPGCEDGTHCSFLVARAGDPRRTLPGFRGATAAVNSDDSNSGMNLFRAAIAPLARGAPFFGAVVATGSHIASLKAVAERRADLAAIDCVSFALIARAQPELCEQAAIVAESLRAPCLPFIASRALPEKTRDAVREALFAALADPALAGPLAAIGLRGARAAAEADYEPILALEQQAIAAGYPRLA